MFNILQKMSLRAKLLTLTAFSLLALAIAFLSAWRTAQMSETFAARQAETSVAQAAREILREASDDGRKPKRRLPPHEREIYERYADAPTRSVALALHAHAEVSGGLCDRSGTPFGFVSADSESEDFSANDAQIAQNACRQIAGANDFQAQKISIGEETFFVAFSADAGENQNRIGGAFAFRRVPETSFFGDWANLLTQLFLLLSAIGLAAFSFLTWRDWQRGMRNVEIGLKAISGDLTRRIEPPQTLELARISRSINDLAAHLEANLRRETELKKSLARNERLAALGRVAAGVAHEVRNPLASMKLKIQLAERGKFETTKLDKTFAVLLEEISRLDNLVRKLLDLSRPPKLDLSEVSLAELIEQRLALLSDKFTETRVKIEIENEARNEFIEVDKGKLAQIFDNLFLNALEAMPDGGNLTVKISETGEIFRAEISDTGAGIAAAHREQLFEPFFTTKDGGTGLGLAISREIAEAHGGRLYFEENASRAAFVVELPRQIER